MKSTQNYPVLRAAYAADLMTLNPVSISAYATVHEAASMLIDRGISAAPVINRAGHPLGVISLSDLVRYSREHVEHVSPRHELYEESELELKKQEHGEGFQVESPDLTTVEEVMTPVIFIARPDTPSAEVVQLMLQHRIHRLFVIDKTNTLVGVITSMDILRAMDCD